MSHSPKKNYYRILDVRPVSSADEIEQAYLKARSACADGSFASYSLDAEDEKKKLLEEIAEAYATLGDPARKAAYDSSMGNDLIEGLCEVDLGYIHGAPGGAPGQVTASSERRDQRGPGWDSAKSRRRHLHPMIRYTIIALWGVILAYGVYYALSEIGY